MDDEEPIHAPPLTYFAMGDVHERTTAAEKFEDKGLIGIVLDSGWNVGARTSKKVFQSVQLCIRNISNTFWKYVFCFARSDRVIAERKITIRKSGSFFLIVRLQNLFA